MMLISNEELKDFRYGAIRQTQDPSKSFDFEEHKSEYDEIGNFVTNGLYTQMKEVYGLKEVFIPEK